MAILQILKQYYIKTKPLWIVSLILLVVHCVVQYFFYLKISGLFTLFIDFTSNILFLATISLALSLLFALIPNKRKGYKEKFKITLPIVIIVLLSLMILSFSYNIFILKQNGFNSRPKNNYKDIVIPANLNCSSIHNGVFETDKCLIERIEKKQIETDKITGKKIEFIVSWISDCEYKLIPLTEGLGHLNVKVVEVTENDYACFVNSDEHEDHSMFIRIKRKK